MLSVAFTLHVRQLFSLRAEQRRTNALLMEVGGDGRVPHPGIGECDRYFVPVKARQHEVMLLALAGASRAAMWLMERMEGATRRLAEYDFERHDAGRRHDPTDD